MKKSLKITAAFLSCVLALGSAACSGTQDRNNDGEENVKMPVDTSAVVSYRGTHIRTAGKTSESVTENGVAKYKIVLPDNYSESLHLWSAASDLKLILNVASGADFLIVTESELSSGDKYISLGLTNAAKEKALTDGLALGENGYVIRTFDKNVYIAGGSDLGVLNGIYGFLELSVDYGVYAADELHVREGDIPLYDFDVTEIPDIQYRVGDVTTYIDGDELYRKRLCYNCNDDVFMYVKGTLYHNSLYYFEDFLDDPDYADWFSADKYQLCYTAHGKAEERERMIDYAADLIVETAKESKSLTVTLQQSDRDVWCGCTNCRAERAKYGTDSAVVIKFMNRLSDVLKEKLEKNDMADRTVNIAFFAYQKTQSAPVTKDERGTYAPIDDSVICRDNVVVYYAPIYADYGKPFDTQNNAGEYDTMLAWKAVCKKLYVWYYQTNFSHYLYPHNSLPTMAERYRFAASAGAEFIFDQNQWDQKTKTAFHRLKAWMGAKLAWNVNLDYDALLDEYFARYFYEAADDMRALFDGMTYHLEKINREDADGTIYFAINQARFFDKALLDGWMKHIKSAYDKIEKYRESDPALFKKLDTRIRIESISVRYMRLELYYSRFSAEDLKKERTEFMNDCLKLGINMQAEISEISPVFSEWGIV